MIKSDTVLRWHRAGFRLFWRRKAKAASNTPRPSRDVLALITRLSQENRLWGAERIRGELLKLAIRVNKRTVQKYMRRARGPRPTGQRWATFSVILPARGCIERERPGATDTLAMSSSP